MTPRAVRGRTFPLDGGLMGELDFKRGENPGVGRKEEDWVRDGTECRRSRFSGRFLSGGWV